MMGGASNDRWPRRGYPFVPALLRRAWYSEPLPESAMRRAGLTSAIVGELDDSVWARIDDNGSLEPMANHVRWLVGTRLYHTPDSALAHKRLFGSGALKNLTLEELPFSTRTRNALRAAGRLESAEWIADATPHDILTLRNAGTTTLLDFATVIERELETISFDATKPGEKMELFTLLDTLSERHPIKDIRAKDPRFELSPSKKNESVREILEATVDAASTPGELDKAEATISHVSQTLDSVAGQPLDQALADLLSIAVSEAQRVPVARRLGWDGKGGCTLQEAGDLGGVTRERIRQLTKKLEKWLDAVDYLPSLDRAIEVLSDAARRLEADSSDLLVSEGITTKPFLPKGVETAAKLIGRDFPLRIGRDGRSVSLPADDRITKVLAEAFRSLNDVNHVAHVEELQSRASDAGDGLPEMDVVAGFLERQEVVWLDDDRQWFWSPQAEGRNRYLNLIRKILSVSDPIAAETLREGVFRYHRTHNTSLPRRVFESLCLSAGFEVQDGEVSSPNNLAPKNELGGTELIFLDVLSEHGGALDLYELRRLCFERGMSRPAFQLYLIYTPILERLAPAVYALRGRSVDPAQVAVLSDKAPSYPKSLQDHGWTRDKAYWLSYRVTEPILHSNVLAVPAAVKRLTGERRLDLVSLDGTDMGEFVVGPESNAWGIGRFIRTRGVDIGDVIVVSMDLEMDIAMIQSGSRDLLVTFSSGDGWGPRRFLEELTSPHVEEDLD